jgi:hypothetical protein
VRATVEKGGIEASICVTGVPVVANCVNEAWPPTG